MECQWDSQASCDLLLLQEERLHEGELYTFEYKY